VHFAPLFGHQYSHVWIDFRGIQDAYMRGRGIDCFENSRRATIAQREYAIANPSGWRGYSGEVWGLTASDGRYDTSMVIDGRASSTRIGREALRPAKCRTSVGSIAITSASIRGPSS
jgi:hypothetical protein